MAALLRLPDAPAGRVARLVEAGQAEGTVAASVDAADDARIVIAAAPAVVQMKFAGSPPEQASRFLCSVVAITIGATATS